MYALSPASTSASNSRASRDAEQQARQERPLLARSTVGGRAGVLELVDDARVEQLRRRGEGVVEQELHRLLLLLLRGRGRTSRRRGRRGCGSRPPRRPAWPPPQNQPQPVRRCISPYTSSSSAKSSPFSVVAGEQVVHARGRGSSARSAVACDRVAADVLGQHRRVHRATGRPRRRSAGTGSRAASRPTRRASSSRPRASSRRRSACSPTRWRRSRTGRASGSGA